MQGSNLRPRGSKPRALPTELTPDISEHLMLIPSSNTEPFRFNWLDLNQRPRGIPPCSTDWATACLSNFSDRINLSCYYIMVDSHGVEP